MDSKIDDRPNSASSSTSDFNGGHYKKNELRGILLSVKEEIEKSIENENNFIRKQKGRLVQDKQTHDFFIFKNRQKIKDGLVKKKNAKATMLVNEFWNAGYRRGVLIIKNSSNSRNKKVHTTREDHRGLLDKPDYSIFKDEMKSKIEIPFIPTDVSSLELSVAFRTKPSIRGRPQPFNIINSLTAKYSGLKRHLSPDHMKNLDVERFPGLHKRSKKLASEIELSRSKISEIISSSRSLHKPKPLELSSIYDPAIPFEQQHFVKIEEQRKSQKMKDKLVKMLQGVVGKSKFMHNDAR